MSEASSSEFLANVPWPVSVIALSLSAIPAGYFCASSGGERIDTGAMVWALVYLVGLTPFFSRRTTAYSINGLLMIALTGNLIAFFGWLIRANAIVVVWIAMAYATEHFSRTLAYGRLIAGQIELEKQQPGASKWINPPSVQRQRMLFVYDLAIVLGVGFVGLWAYQSIR